MPNVHALHLSATRTSPTKASDRFHTQIACEYNSSRRQISVFRLFAQEIRSKNVNNYREARSLIVVFIIWFLGNSQTHLHPFIQVCACVLCSHTHTIEQRRLAYQVKAATQVQKCTTRVRLWLCVADARANNYTTKTHTRNDRASSNRKTETNRHYSISFVRRPNTWLVTAVARALADSLENRFYFIFRSSVKSAIRILIDALLVLRRQRVFDLFASLPFARLRSSAVRSIEFFFFLFIYFCDDAMVRAVVQMRASNVKKLSFGENIEQLAKTA